MSSVETWRDVVGYVGLYQVSDAGRVRSVERVVVDSYDTATRRKAVRVFASRVLKPWAHGRFRDYRAVSLSSGGARIKFLVHRLVAEAFIPNPEGKAQVNHKDGNPTNNAAENLEWSTNSENNLHAYRVLGRVSGHTGRRGSLCKNSKTVRVSGAFDFSSSREAAEFLGVTQSAVSIAARQGRACGGHYVEYI